MASLGDATKWLEEQQPEPEVLFLREMLERHQMLLQQHVLQAEETKELQTELHRALDTTERLRSALGERASETAKVQEKLGHVREERDRLQDQLNQALAVLDRVRDLDQAYALWLREQPAARRSQG